MCVCVCVCVVGSISLGGPIELFLVPASASQIVYTKAIVCVWDGAYQRFFTSDKKE